MGKDELASFRESELTAAGRIKQIYMLRHEGKAKAITREKFQVKHAADLEGISDREFRRVCSQPEKIGILSCNTGYYYPVKETELFEFGYYIDKYIESLKARRLQTFLQHRHLFANGIPPKWDGQGRLF